MRRNGVDERQAVDLGAMREAGMLDLEDDAVLSRSIAEPATELVEKRLLRLGRVQRVMTKYGYEGADPSRGRMSPAEIDEFFMEMDRKPRDGA